MTVITTKILRALAYIKRDTFAVIFASWLTSRFRVALRRTRENIDVNSTYYERTKETKRARGKIHVIRMSKFSLFSFLCSAKIADRESGRS